MLPGAEEFILDLRRAARTERKPTVAADSGSIDTDAMTQVLQRAALWLNSKVVEKYDPSDFSWLPGDQQDELRHAVDAFRTVAGTVPPDEPASDDQFRRGLVAFKGLQASVRKLVLNEWAGAAGILLGEAETWCEELGWHTRRYEKTLMESLLGKYTLQQLQIYAVQHLYVLDPIARFVPGGQGAFDLSIQPSFYVTSVYRDFDGSWNVHLDVGQDVSEGRGVPWGKDSFMKAVEELRSLL
jgi:hypothetical protein